MRFIDVGIDGARLGKASGGCYFFANIYQVGRRAFVVVDTAAVAADVGGNDVHVGVAGVVMAVGEPGLVFEVDVFHEFCGDGDHFFVGNFIIGVEVKGDMDGVGFGAFVEDGEVFKPV